MKCLPMWCLGLCLLVKVGGAAVLGEHHGQERVLHGKRLSDKEHHLDGEDGHEDDFDYDHEAFLGADEAHEARHGETAAARHSGEATQRQYRYYGGPRPRAASIRNTRTSGIPVTRIFRYRYAMVSRSAGG